MSSQATALTRRMFFIGFRKMVHALLRLLKYIDPASTHQSGVVEMRLNPRVAKPHGTSVTPVWPMPLFFPTLFLDPSGIV